MFYFTCDRSFARVLVFVFDNVADAVAADFLRRFLSATELKLRHQSTE